MAFSQAVVFRTEYGAGCVTDKRRPHPYRTVENWVQLPADGCGGVERGRNRSRRKEVGRRALWAQRACLDSPASIRFSASMSGSSEEFGAGLLVSPHGIYGSRRQRLGD
jgi:hypothetical protein